MNVSDLNDSEWQNFLYLLLVLLSLFGSLSLRRGIGFKKVIKYFAIWSAFALFVMSLYSYRYEFSDFKNRLLGELNPSAARIDNSSGQIVIHLSRDGHFYINLEVNEVSMRFMIDTGASDVVLNLDEAKRIGIDTKKLVFNKPYQTANGTSWGAYVKLKRVKIGNLEFSDVSASVNGSQMGTSLLGMSFLRQFKKYEFYQDKLILSI